MPHVGCGEYGLLLISNKTIPIRIPPWKKERPYIHMYSRSKLLNNSYY
jgi:hypothetical protein